MNLKRSKIPLLVVSLLLNACSHAPRRPESALQNALNGRLHELAPVADSERTDHGLKIYFATDSLFAPHHTNLRPEAQKNLISLADLLSKYHHDALRISASADGLRNPSVEDHRLAAERAAAIRAYFVAKGVRNNMSTNALASRGPATEIFVDFAPVQTTVADDMSR